MNLLIKKVLEFKKTNNEKIYEDIISRLNYLINKQCSKINSYYKEDLRQELLFEIYKKLSQYKILKMDEINLDYENKKNNKYYNIFKEIYQKEAETQNYNILNENNEFYLFYLENQFRKYINILCNHIRIDFCRKHKINENLKNISLNRIGNDEEEYIYKIIDQSENSAAVKINYSLLNEEELNFIKLFYENDTILTEKEVAKKLGITQQAVSSRLQKIKKKYILNKQRNN